jgi:hypothetical protein
LPVGQLAALAAAMAENLECAAEDVELDHER